MNRIPDLLTLRLASQGLTEPGFETPEQVIARLGAVQSQDYAAALWGLGLRLREATARSVEAAFNEGLFLRTHVLRPTWHFVLPSELRWMLKLTAPRVLAAMAYNNRRIELDAAVLKRSRAVLVKALRGGRQLQRTETAAVLEDAGIDTSGLRLSHLTMNAELEGVICSGARQGRQFTYALLDERVPPAPEISRDEALARLARLYFNGHGPATLKDFGWWSGLTLADARRGAEALGTELRQEDGYWSGAESLPLQKVRGRAWLLPNFDEYVVAYTERGDFFDSAHDEGRLPRNSFLASHSLLIGGRVAGTWRRTLKKDSVMVELSPSSPMSSAEVASVRARGRTLRGVPRPAPGDGMSIEEAYNRWSASYDRDQNLTRDLDGTMIRGALGEMRFHSILEAGCGTGKNTGFLAGIGARLCAMDFSAGMLSQAAAKSPPAHVHFLRADLSRPWPLRVEAFDLLTFNLVLEHIESLADVFPQAARVLAPGGLLYVSELHPFRQYQGKKAEFSTGEGRAEIPAYVHHISDFLGAASGSGLRFLDFVEGWHEQDAGKPPRLAVFRFRTLLTYL